MTDCPGCFRGSGNARNETIPRSRDRANPPPPRPGAPSRCVISRAGISPRGPRPSLRDPGRDNPAITGRDAARPALSTGRWRRRMAGSFTRPRRNDSKRERDSGHGEPVGFSPPQPWPAYWWEPAGRRRPSTSWRGSMPPGCVRSWSRIVWAAIPARRGWESWIWSGLAPSSRCGAICPPGRKSWRCSPVSRCRPKELSSPAWRPEARRSSGYGVHPRPVQRRSPEGEHPQLPDWKSPLGCAPRLGRQDPIRNQHRPGPGPASGPRHQDPESGSGPGQRSVVKGQQLGP